ncbi:MATE family efflux transporter [Alcaligenes endophyticus]|uniref:Multidrug-efflux transporter n=1 Tax=Alcaligenes endophyticus TaxID=1929088 RepID=A0ABT8EIC2_9BURK|nr:MATE family efflux transporter [Alcaligenes endophyticus]MCX5592687.1 MATE family efflux transporter [Alcaligenes endophyticus]MDN4120875.1 MATE family efflux transporter [Alcaligenes endophyticus]
MFSSALLSPIAWRQASKILHQAWPVLLGSWASIIFGVLDTAMTGHASAADLQAMGLGVSIYITVFIGLMGVLHALIPILAQSYGAHHNLEVGRMWGQGVWLSLFLTALGSIALLFPDLWLSASGQLEPEVHDKIVMYLRSLILALPAALIFRTIYALGTAVSRPKMVMLINLASVLFKALLNWLLIFGKWGLPAMGAVGSGLATTIVSWLMLIAGIILLKRDSFFQRFKLQLGRPLWRDQKELLRLGIPMGGSYLIEIFAFTFMALLVAREGKFVSGGHQIMANLAAVSFMIPMAIGVATASITAQAIGAGQLHRARITGNYGVVIVFLFACLTAGLLLATRGTLAQLYSNDIEVVVMALALLQLLPLFHFCDALQCVVTYILRAYKIAFIPMLMQIIALSGVGLGGGWWLGFGPGKGQLDNFLLRLSPNMPSGAGSMWLMSSSGLGLSAVLLLLWYTHVLRTYPKSKRRINLPDPDAPLS